MDERQRCAPTTPHSTYLTARQCTLVGCETELATNATLLGDLELERSLGLGLERGRST